MQTKTWSFNGSLVTATIEDNFELNIEDALRIDYGNIMGELLTFPITLNRIGVLLEEIKHYKRMTEFNLETQKNELDKLRGIAEMKAFRELKNGVDGNAPINSPTKDQIQARVRINEEHQIHEKAYRDKKLELLEIEKDEGNVNTFYWSAKSKMNILEKMTDKLSPEEFVLDKIDGIMNGVQILCNKKLIPDAPSRPY